MYGICGIIDHIFKSGERIDTIYSINYRGYIMGKNIYNCPNCGSSVEISDQIDTFFCTYCGTKIYSGDKNRINAQLSVKKMEHDVKKTQLNNQNIKLLVLMMLGMFAMLILLAVVLTINDFVNGNHSDDASTTTQIKLEYNKTILIGESYKDVNDYLSDNGFKNIETIEMDKKAPAFKKPGEVDRVVIGGSTEFSQGDYFDPDVEVKIYYYNLEK